MGKAYEWKRWELIFISAKLKVINSVRYRMKECSFQLDTINVLFLANQLCAAEILYYISCCQSNQITVWFSLWKNFHCLFKIKAWKATFLYLKDLGHYWWCYVRITPNSWDTCKWVRISFTFYQNLSKSVPDPLVLGVSLRHWK